MIPPFLAPALFIPPSTSPLMGLPSPNKAGGMIEPEDFFSKLSDTEKVKSVAVSVSYRHFLDRNRSEADFIFNTFELSDEEIKVSYIPANEAYFDFNHFGYTSKVYACLPGRQGKEPTGTFEGCFHKIQTPDGVVIRSISGRVRIICEPISSAHFKIKSLNIIHRLSA